MDRGQMKNRNRLCQAESAGVILRTSATNPMTLIETTNNGTFHTLTTEKGNVVEVSTALGHVMVFIQRKGLKQLAKGRRFASVAAAAEAYKAADIKAALYALAA